MAEAIRFDAETTFAIVGAGRVGTSIGTLLKRAGHKIVGCSARSIDSLDRAVRYLKCPSSTNPLEFVAAADCILIAVPDDSVSTVAEALADGAAFAGKYAVHLAGSIGLEPLAPLASAGAETMAIHVLQAVPDVEAGIERIPGSWFGVTCADHMRSWAEEYVGVLGGKVMWVSEEERVVYHASAALTSNYLVVLAALVELLGVSPEPYLPLMRGTLANIERLGPLTALTGPIVRGDSGTVLRHLLEIDETSPEVAAAYRVLGESALRAAERAGRIDLSSARSIREVLRPKGSSGEDDGQG